MARMMGLGAPGMDDVGLDVILGFQRHWSTLKCYNTSITASQSAAAGPRLPTRTGKTTMMVTAQEVAEVSNQA